MNCAVCGRDVAPPLIQHLTDDGKSVLFCLECSMRHGETLLLYQLAARNLPAKFVTEWREEWKRTQAQD